MRIARVDFDGVTDLGLVLVDKLVNDFYSGSHRSSINNHLANPNRHLYELGTASNL